MKRGSFFKKVAALLAAATLFTSCGKQSSEEIVDMPPIETEEETHTIEMSEYEIEQMYQDKLTDLYADYFQDYPVNYNHIEEYLSNEQVDQIIEYSNIETHCERRYELDPELFFDILKENSENYVSLHPEFRIPFLEEPYVEKHVVDFEANLRYTINTIINGKNDIYEDLHQVEKLTVVFGNASKFYSNSEDDERYYLVYASEDDSVILGVYDSVQNIIVVDDEAIELITSMYYELEDQQEKFNDILLETLLHEFNHVRQKACECRVNQGLVLDNMFVYDGSYISTISEASAESDLYIMGKYPHGYGMQFGDYVYESERADELLLLTLAICNEDAKIEDYYNAISNTDYAALYNFYDLRSREEIYDFYHIVYSIDSKNFRNNLWEKIYTEEELEEKTYFDYNVDIGYAYRVDIFRMVLEKLTEFTDKKGPKSFTLRDNLAVFNILKNIVVKDAYEYYEDDTNPEMVRYRKYYEEYMVSNIVILENRYVDYLSQYYGVSVSDIRKMENTEISEYVQTLINVANYEYSGNSKDKEALSLFGRLPILDSLLRKRYISFYDYPDFIEDNQELIFGP
ncbi:MAG: hypothetical protein OSJ70_09585 [Bacilli bacterium]|nr:hypothetical protein [Bacilli bacterium]